MPPALFVSVAAMWTLAVVTPGPNFLAAARSRSAEAGQTRVGLDTPRPEHGANWPETVICYYNATI